MAKELYEWQEDCLGKWLKNGGRGMVQAVTGSGKTFLALTAAARLDHAWGECLRVKIVVPTGELMRQWDRSLREFLAASDREEKTAGSFRGVVGLRGGGHKAKPDCKYMIYVVNSARYELASQILTELRQGEAVLMIADECHHYESGQNRLIFEFLSHLNEEQAARFFSLGLSATLPTGQAGRYLGSVLGRKICHYGMAEASEQNTVCEYDIFHIGLSLQDAERDEYEELSEQMFVLYRRLLQKYPYLRDMNQKERFEELRLLAGDKDTSTAQMALGYLQLTFQRTKLVCLASERVACACDLAECLDPGGKIIIFGERISQAEELYRLLQEKYPERVGRYHSRMGQQANKNVIERFREGDVRILVACKALDEGVDIPDASVGMILSGTSVMRQRIQRVGRIIRRKEGKGRACLYYLHVAETTEDVCFLPDGGNGHIFELEYNSDMRGFSHPEYDGRAEALLRNMKASRATEEELQEACRCLRLGCVRPDWTMKENEIGRRMEEARCLEEKNYWVCMKKLVSVHGLVERKE